MAQNNIGGQGGEEKGTVRTDAQGDPATPATTRSSSMPRSKYSMTRATPG